MEFVYCFLRVDFLLKSESVFRKGMRKLLGSLWQFVFITRVMHATVPIPALASASVLHSAAVGGSVVGVVGPLWTFGELNSCELGVFRF